MLGHAQRRAGRAAARRRAAGAHVDERGLRHGADRADHRGASAGAAVAVRRREARGRQADGRFHRCSTCRSRSCARSTRSARSSQRARSCRRSSPGARRGRPAAGLAASPARPHVRRRHGRRVRRRRASAGRPSARRCSSAPASTSRSGTSSRSSASCSAASSWSSRTRSACDREQRGRAPDLESGASRES